MDKNSMDAYNEAVNNVNDAKETIIRMSSTNDVEEVKVQNPNNFEYVSKELNNGGGEYRSEPKKAKKKKGRPVLKAAGCVLLVGVFGVTVGVGTQFGEKLFTENSFESTLASGNSLNSGESNLQNPNVNESAENAVSNLDEEVNEVIKNVNSVNTELKDSLKSVVCVNSVFQSTANSYYYGSQEQTGSGSAVFYAEDNDKVYLVTNNHVVSGATQVTISMDSNSDDVAIDAHLVGTSPDTDIAVIYVDKADLIENNIDYKIIPIGDSDKLEQLDTVYVIGNAAGEGKTITSGIVSAVNKSLETENGSQVSAIQTDASVNPGNSGGAMVDQDGKLVGINFAKLVDSTIEGMGFAIPSNLVVEVADGFIESYNPNKVYIGISGSTVTEEMLSYFNLPSMGVYVAEVLSGGGAEAAGLQANDIIVGIDEVKVEAFEDLSTYLNTKEAGDKVIVYFYRGNRPMTTEVTLGSYADTSF
ncbi:MAG: S1C family serine protease [Lachnospirales bacterium]